MSTVLPSLLPAYELGPLPRGRRMTTVDELLVRAPLARIFDLASRVTEWPRHLAHYRYVRFRERRADGGGLVEMSANRPFGIFQWPTYWLSEMAVQQAGHRESGSPSVRFRHVGGITRGMDVEWSFAPEGERTRVQIVHVWDGPGWPLIGSVAATAIIGPVFVHGIASRTLAGLGRVAEAHQL